jgi:4-hydroxy-tetrahydrodipicolinate reductase
MGLQMTAAVAADPRLSLVARFGRPGASGDGLVSQDAALAAADVVIDFTTPAVSRRSPRPAPRVAARRSVIGSTGFDAAQIAEIEAAARKIAIVRAGNFSTRRQHADGSGRAGGPCARARGL